LDLVLHHEELAWFQKSCKKWLQDGDRNTRYYHLKTISKNKKAIQMLHNEEGV